MAQNTDFAAIAKKEAGNGPDKYRRWYYNSSGSGIDWCAIFVSWCASQVNILDTLVPRASGAGDFARCGVARSLGKWYEAGITPLPGDIISFCWNGLGYQPGRDKYFSNHVGIVLEVKNSTIYTIEGNTGSSSNNSSLVTQKSYNIKNTYINGFYRPNWKTSSGTSSSNSSSSGTQSGTSSSESIKTVQSYVNRHYDLNINADGIYGPQTQSALIGAFQTYLDRHYSANLRVDGVFGQDTKAAINNIKNGDKGNGVYLLQGMLICHNYNTNGFDGIFGSATESSVRSFQKKWNLSVDGIAGKNTIEKLLTTGV